MKRIYSISSILEQETSTEGATDTPNEVIKFTITDTAVSPKPFIKLQWTYQYSWPKATPGLGTSEELAKIIASTTDKPKDAKVILAEVAKSPNSVVGIARNAGNDTNNRLFGKDMLSTIGYVYLFKPNKIDMTKVPSDKKLGKIGNLEVFEVDADFPKYLVTGAAVVSPTSQSNTASSSNTPGKTGAVKLEDFISMNQKYSEWYNIKVRIPYLQPVVNTIGDARVSIETSGKITRLFWTLVNGLDSPYHVDAPGSEAGLKEFTRELKSALEQILTDAKVYDPAQFGTTSVDSLNRETFKLILNGLILIGFNTGKITTGAGSHVENEILPTYYKKVLDAVKLDTKWVLQAEATANFDGTAINNETDLAKVLSGAFIGYDPAADVDTIDKVKATWDAKGNSTFAEIVAKLPFKANDVKSSNLPEFQVIQFYLLPSNKPGIYGPQTTAAVKAAFEKSKIQ
jgi:hypothetical protein